MKTDIKVDFSIIPLAKKMIVIRNFNDFMNEVVIPDYHSNGYTIKQKMVFPLKDKKKVPKEYFQLPGFTYSFRKGKQIGTKISAVWNDKDYDELVIRTEKDSILWKAVLYTSVIFFALLFYGLTIYYYYYWLIVLIILIKFFCIGHFIVLGLALLPFGLSLLLGYSIASIIVWFAEKKETKEMNERDREYLLKLAEQKAKVLSEFSKK